MEELISLAAKNGIWTLMSIVLLIYVLQDSRKRETKYIEREDKYIEREKEYILTIRENQNLNKELSKRLATIDLMHKDITDIKNQLGR